MTSVLTIARMRTHATPRILFLFPHNLAKENFVGYHRPMIPASNVSATKEMQPKESEITSSPIPLFVCSPLPRRRGLKKV